MIVLLLGIACLVASLFYKRKIFWMLLALLCFAFHFEVFVMTGSASNINFSSQNFLSFICYLLGIVMIWTELYIPDFGVLGMIGSFTSVFGLYMYHDDWLRVLMIVLAVLVLSGLECLFFIKAGRQFEVPSMFVLDQRLGKAEGYSSHQDYPEIIGLIGTVVMDLRPVGRGRFNGETYEIISQQGFIAKGRAVRIVKVTNGSIYVIEEEA